MERGYRGRGPGPGPQGADHKDYFDALHPFGAGDAYVNFTMEEGEDRIRATYRGNHDGLVNVKAK